MDLPCLDQHADGSITLRLHVQPRASANSLAGLQGDLLKLRLTTPPVDGKANKAVIAYLAKLFHLPKSAITLKSGHQSRSKTMVITGLTLQDVQAILLRHLV
ncbi:MAG: DUF167 domain-containing protein [Desulfobulbus sp.]|nr:DUF167 domain-containing protein [Desulfobulbus sp.]